MRASEFDAPQLAPKSGAFLKVNSMINKNVNSDEMEKLEPENDNEQMLVNALLAKCRGVDVEVKELGNWVLSNSAIFPSAIYRIKPKATPLPIPNWFWNGISKSLTKAVLDPELDTITFFPKYVTPRIEDGHWITDDHPYYNYVNPALIGVSLKDIDWRLSLTERQGEVNHES